MIFVIAGWGEMFEAWLPIRLKLEGSKRMIEMFVFWPYRNGLSQPGLQGNSNLKCECFENIDISIKNISSWDR